MAGSVFRDDAGYAVWDVSSRSSWALLVGETITSAWMNYRIWAPDDGFWCSRISLVVGETRVEILLGEGHTDKPMAPSSNNVAILFAPAALPRWEATEAP